MSGMSVSSAAVQPKVWTGASGGAAPKAAATPKAPVPERPSPEGIGGAIDIKA